MLKHSNAIGIWVFIFMLGFAIDLHAQALEPAFTFHGGLPHDQFGYSVATIGDIDRDGFNDFVVGAPQLGTPPPPPSDPCNLCGYATTYSGRDGHMIRSTGGSDFFVGYGFSVAGLGDVDDDHIPDYIVGAPKPELHEPGYAVVMMRTREQVLVGDQSDDLFGYDVTNAGDVNGDGIEDVAVGAPGADNGDGKVWIFSGANIRFGQAAALLQTLQVPDAHGLGSDIAQAGDINHDGFGDLVVGGWDEKAYVFLGGPTGLNLMATELTLGAFIAAVEGIGDVNYDGFDDVLVSSETESSLFLYLGSAAGVTTVPIVLGPPSTLTPDSQYVGYAISKSRDMTCDQQLEILVGVPLSGFGKAHFYTFNRTTNQFDLFGSPTAMQGEIEGEQFGFSVALSYRGGLDDYSHGIVGSPMKSPGHADVFQYDCGGITPTPTPTPTPDPTPTPSSGGGSAGGSGGGTGATSAAAERVETASSGGCSHAVGNPGEIDLLLLLLTMAPAFWLGRRARN